MRKECLKPKDIAEASDVAGKVGRDPIPCIHLNAMRKEYLKLKDFAEASDVAGKVRCTLMRLQQFTAVLELEGPC